MYLPVVLFFVVDDDAVVVVLSTTQHCEAHVPPVDVDVNVYASFLMYCRFLLSMFLVLISYVL